MHEAETTGLNITPKLHDLMEIHSVVKEYKIIKQLMEEAADTTEESSR